MTYPSADRPTADEAKRALADLRAFSLLLACLEAPAEVRWLPARALLTVPDGAPRDLLRWLAHDYARLSADASGRSWAGALDARAAAARREDVRVLLRGLLTAGRAAPVLLGDGRARLWAWADPQPVRAVAPGADRWARAITRGAA